MKKKRTQTAFSSLRYQHKRHPGRWMQWGSPVPVPTDDAYEHARRSFTSQPPSPWQHFTAWLRYYYIQTRWDIERRLARKLHRRWGDQL